ncbi:hypothetical protein [Metamycoplasma hominis]|uniref:hypothetical protein n=1 Tax=Metamycoplasma hominis TaxID=2098 RepID=UPI003CF32E48
MKHTAEELAEIKERKRLKKETKKEKGSVGKIDINPYGVNFFNIWKKFPKKMVMLLFQPFYTILVLQHFWLRLPLLQLGYLHWFKPLL